MLVICVCLDLLFWCGFWVVWRVSVIVVVVWIRLGYCCFAALWRFGLAFGTVGWWLGDFTGFAAFFDLVCGWPMLIFHVW